MTNSSSSTKFAGDGVKTRLLLLLIPTFLIVFDQITKQLVFENFFIGQRLPVIDGLLYITHIQNPGSAFGIFASMSDPFRSLFLGGLALIALFLVVYYSLRISARHLFLQISLHLVFAGAVGNLIDRVVKGSVTDFILFSHGEWSFPAFNVADSAIVVGVTFLLIETFLLDGVFSGQEKKEDPAADALSAAADLDLSGPRRPDVSEFESEPVRKPEHD